MMYVTSLALECDKTIEAEVMAAIFSRYRIELPRWILVLIASFL